ncbi:hypothetical protein D5281_04835 [bacterium 1xD42-62]|uniref:Uncharacterized protein n=1 Tax=Parablautia muri TaxID=2320879 RepID=A0A9X5BDV4_9FIRM|nr:hypothetical protein [Parablautia muri]
MLDVENLPHEWQNIPKSIWVVFAIFMGRFFVWKKRMEVNLFMKYIRDIYSVQLIQLLADCAEDN